LRTVYFCAASALALVCSSSATAASVVVEISGGGGPQIFEVGSNGRAELSRSLPEATASGYADLRTGKLGAGAFTTGVATDASASFRDRLLVTIPGATAETLTPISFGIKLDGIRGGSERNLTQMYIGYQFGTEGSNLGAYLYHTAGTQSGNSLESTCAISTVTEFGLRGTCAYFLKGSEAVVLINAVLRVQATNPGGIGIAYSDYTNTSALSLRLPEGVTFVSESGFFGTAASVPEPGTWAMMVLGFGAIGAVRRRLNRPRQAATGLIRDTRRS